MSAVPEPELPGPPSPVEPGATLGVYEIGPRIAIRGDVHLHAGTDPRDAPVRIAVWRYRGSEPLPRFLDQLRDDAAAWGALRPVDGRMPAIVPTLDVGRQVNSVVCYWIQEDPRGPSLADQLDHTPILAPRYALGLAQQLGAALDELHNPVGGPHAGHAVGRRRLIHGDLDPANVHLLGHYDVARLAWGGLAVRIESSGMSAGRGTARGLAEVAPEVLQGGAPDARSDVYGLSALLYRML
ncbi:MAG: hypothetical protein ABMB14_11075, partial [Myxococcota bacterium]